MVMVMAGSMGCCGGRERGKVLICYGQGGQGWELLIYSSEAGSARRWWNILA